MRICVQFEVDAAVGNEAIRSGKIQKVLEQFQADLKPEATYFFPSNGKRGGIFIINTDDPTIDFQVLERLSFGLQASVRISPCMRGEDLAHGFADLEAIIKAYG